MKLQGTSYEEGVQVVSFVLWGYMSCLITYCCISFWAYWLLTFSHTINQRFSNKILYCTTDLFEPKLSILFSSDLSRMEKHGVRFLVPDSADSSSASEMVTNVVVSTSTTITKSPRTSPRKRPSVFSLVRNSVLFISFHVRYQPTFVYFFENGFYSRKMPLLSENIIALWETSSPAPGLPTPLSLSMFSFFCL